MKMEVKGPKHYKVFVDGVEAGGELKLSPDHHTVAIKFLAEPKDTDSVKVVLDAQQAVDYTLGKKHPYMVHDLTDGRRVRNISLSADGTVALLIFQTTEREGKDRWEYELRDVKTQQLLGRPSQNIRRLPRACA